jgi:hypothetical protein
MREELRGELYGALAKAMAEVHSIVQDGEHPTLRYKYASANAIAAEARRVLAKNGLAILPSCTDGDKAQMLEITFVVGHSSGQAMECRWDWYVDKPHRGSDTGKMRAGSITHAKKFFLLQLLCLDRVGQEEWDAHHQPQEETPSPQPRSVEVAPPPAPTPAAPREDNPVAQSELVGLAEALRSAVVKYSADKDDLAKQMEAWVGRPVVKDGGLCDMSRSEFRLLVGKLRAWGDDMARAAEQMRAMKLEPEEVPF